jgi:molybdate transport system substrate-binding protein
LAAPPELFVAAASDLAPLEQQISSKFQRITGVRLRFSFGSSGTLARQIENGAPFDVYLSADEQYVADLSAQGFVGQAKVYAIGRLVLWSASPQFRSVEKLTSPAVRHIAIANPAHAPYGRAAKQALERLGVLRILEPKIVYGENVRQAFEMARSGNAEIAIVSATLGGNGGVVLPAHLHDPVRQAGAIVSGTSNPALATRFLDFLTSAEGSAVLESGGLEAPRPASTSPKTAYGRQSPTKK